MTDNYDHAIHGHRQIGYPVRMTPTTKPNLAWRCECGYWQFSRNDTTWHPPADDETIRCMFLDRMNGATV